LSCPPCLPAAFQWDDFAAKNNAELNDNLGNFINRTLKFIWSRWVGGRVATRLSGMRRQRRHARGVVAVVAVVAVTICRSPKAAANFACLFEPLPSSRSTTHQFNV